MKIQNLKTVHIFLLSAFICTFVFATNSQTTAECNRLKEADKTLDSTIKIYERVWNDAVNKGLIDELNENNFTRDITMIISPENIVGIEAGHSYVRAKFIANQTVDKFIVDHPDLTFEITSVSPVGVMGKALSQREDSTSISVQYLLKNKIAPNPFIQMFYDKNVDWALIDVADVADGEYQTAITKGLHGKNYMLSSESYPISDITLMLNNQEPEREAKIIYQNDLAK
jgi:hypothetical protein